MKAYRVQHINYDRSDRNTHELLIQTLNNDIEKYPTPEEWVYEFEAPLTCFKTESQAKDFIYDMELEYQDNWDFYEEKFPNQTPWSYELIEKEVVEDDIIWEDDYQVVVYGYKTA